MKNICSILCICLLCLACNHQTVNNKEVFFKGTDSYQREVVLENEPLRVVSFSQAVTEAIYLLHAEKKLVGISKFCTYPPETEAVPKVGDLLNINVESVLQQRPDLIIVGSVVSKSTVEKFEKAGIPVYCLKEEKRLADLPNLVRVTGKLLNKSAEAEKLADEYAEKISHAKSQSRVSEKTVYYVVGYGATGDFTAAGNTFIHDIITLAGGKNIGQALTTWNVSREFLFQQNPDCIFIREEDCENFCHTKPYMELEAVKSGHVYPIPSGWIDNLCPRNFNAIDYISAKLQDSIR